MMRFLTSLLLLYLVPAMATADVTKTDLVGRWDCHESRNGTSQTSQLIYRNSGRFKIKFSMQFSDTPTGMRGTLVGKWALQDAMITMQVVRSRISNTSKGGVDIGVTVTVSDKTTRSEILEFSGDHMVLQSTSGAGPMRCTRVR